jgi:hypothetical protein
MNEARHICILAFWFGLAPADALTVIVASVLAWRRGH